MAYNYEKDLVDKGWIEKASFSLEYEPYQYYMALVCVDRDGGYWVTTDSGCSCPTPFENTTIDDFTGPLTLEQLTEELISLDDTGDLTEQVIRKKLRV